ncbi:hypothetical protein A374_04714 [Fictibacillus macauensis ZFHKF-1]|uniref:Uncharacterized protein n=1 Tax=Fictibacillus macauensis ZFHKF-1 TaxID=1196324 RepID=I8ALP4_9BACL|nr:hypothetical protein A374_04714 [Fictibacillus macauensis ZFHKF-1]
MHLFQREQEKKLLYTFRFIERVKNISGFSGVGKTHLVTSIRIVAEKKADKRLFH